MYPRISGTNIQLTATCIAPRGLQMDLPLECDLARMRAEGIGAAYKGIKIPTWNNKRADLWPTRSVDALPVHNCQLEDCFMMHRLSRPTKNEILIVLPWCWEV